MHASPRACFSFNHKNFTNFSLLLSAFTFTSCERPKTSSNAKSELQRVRSSLGQSNLDQTVSPPLNESKLKPLPTANQQVNSILSKAETIRDHQTISQSHTARKTPLQIQPATLGVRWRNVNINNFASSTKEPNKLTVVYFYAD